MRAYIANTDYGWYQFLSRQESLEEVNFWRPFGGRSFKALSPDEPLIFKLKSRYDHAIVGFGFFVAYVRLSVPEAWRIFGRGNGAESLDDIWTRIRKYVERSGKRVAPSHQIGCLLLASPVFFPQSHWIQGPRDWKRQIVAGKGYDTTQGEGRRIWQECLQRAESLRAPVIEHIVGADTDQRYGKDLIVRPRLGQGTFRFAVQRAYGRCAVTGEHSLPALEASHIIPYSEGGRHEIPNGLLLRADIHRLYDGGYVTVTPDREFRVSPRLEKEFQNGRVYYELDGRRIIVPSRDADRPDEAYLEYHSEHVFLDG